MRSAGQALATTNDALTALALLRDGATGPRVPFPWSGVSQAMLKPGARLIHQPHFLHYPVVPTHTATTPS